jgi:tRNA pseudouridine65 synthase
METADPNDARKIALRDLRERVPSDPIGLLYVDEHLVVADKPSGLLVHRGWDNDDDVAMFRVRDAIGEHVFPVHRLDRGTSGALLFARNPTIAALLAGAFEEGKIEKQYLALVRGNPPDDGVIDYAIQKKEDGPRVPALTRYRVVGRSPVDRCSLVLAMPETGRLHQIRRHLRHIDHPLIGDVKHGSGQINRHYRTTYNLHRLALHASRLAFDHPVTKQRIEITCNLPSDLVIPFAALGLAQAELRAGVQE